MRNTRTITFGRKSKRSKKRINRGGVKSVRHSARQSVRQPAAATLIQRAFRNKKKSQKQRAEKKHAADMDDLTTMFGKVSGVGAPVSWRQPSPNVNELTSAFSKLSGITKSKKKNRRKKLTKPKSHRRKK